MGGSFAWRSLAEQQVSTVGGGVLKCIETLSGRDYLVGTCRDLTLDMLRGSPGGVHKSQQTLCSFSPISRWQFACIRYVRACRAVSTAHHSPPIRGRHETWRGPGGRAAGRAPGWPAATAAPRPRQRLFKGLGEGRRRPPTHPDVNEYCWHVTPKIEGHSPFTIHCARSPGGHKIRIPGQFSAKIKKTDHPKKYHPSEFLGEIQRWPSKC